MDIKNRKAQLVWLCLIFGTCFIIECASQFQSIEPEVQKQIDDYITNVFLPKTGTTRMGLSIVQDNGKVLYSRGFGLANEDKGIPNGNKTQFLIGSITKSFTALLAVKTLHEQFPEMGEAVLDTPIRKLIPSANFTLIDRFRSEHTTFRDLLGHRMCLLRDDLTIFSEPFSTTSEVVYRQRYAQEMCGMRSEYQYNNHMYTVAGYLTGVLVNKTYPELMDNLLKDIGMLNSSLTSRSDDFANMPHRAHPYYNLNNASHPMNPELIKRVVVTSPAGALFATPDDMAKYMRFHLNKGKNVEGKQIIPERVMTWLTKSSSVMPAVPFKSQEEDVFLSFFAYGLGLGLASYDGWECIFHNGHVAPYNSFMSLFPSQNLGFFTVTSEGPTITVDQFMVHSFIFELLRGNVNATEKVSKLSEKLDAQRIEKMTKKDEALKTILEEGISNWYGQERSTKEVVGIYGSGSSGDVEIVEKFNNQTNTTGLYVSYGKWYKGWLENTGGSTYHITWDTEVIQDDYAHGNSESLGYIRFQNETLEFLVTLADFPMQANFKLGVSLDTLPPIPYSPGSCGPDTE